MDKGEAIELKLRIDWSELDYFQHVNNVSYFKYLQASRLNYWIEIGLEKYHEERNQSPLLVSCSCDFKKPLLFPGNVRIESTVSFIGFSSFGLDHLLFNDDNELVATGKDVMVMMDLTRNEKMAFPQEIKSKIEELTGRSFNQ